jgi:Holliday junction DNA helicase RuvA
MIAHLRGRLLRKGPQEAILDVGGVGYRVLVPVPTFCRLGEVGAEVSLRIHTHVREDALVLFGFLSPLEQELFERLIAVVGVGPKLALSILSGIETDDLLSALRAADLTRLVRIPGVGRKTAERLVMELKDKLPAPTTSALPSAAPSPVKEDLISAFANLGYSRSEADKGVERALRELPDARFEDLLRRALQVVSGR